MAVQALMLTAMLMWGLNQTLVKMLIAWFDPILMASLRMIVASAAFAAILYWRRVATVRVSARQFMALCGCALLMVYANQVLFTEGLKRSTATNASLFMALSPLVSTLLAALVFGERLTPTRLAGVELGIGGVAAVVLSHPGANLAHAGLGDLLIAGSVIAFASGGVVLQRIARGLPALWISLAIYLIGSAMLTVHTLVGPATISMATVFPGWVAWGVLLLSALASTAFGNAVWNQAIATIGIGRTAVYFYWVPIFGVMFAALLLGESLTGWHLVGFVAVMAGTWLGTRRAPVIDAPAPARCTP